jgi:glycosyltransferase involved in cell wall biosynthesis
VRIALLVAGLPPDRIGGAEVQAMHVARHLVNRQHHVCVYTRTTSIPAELASLSRCVVICRCGVRVPAIRFVMDVLMTLTRLWRARHRTDVILAYQSIIDGVIAVLAKALLRIPVVVSVRSPIEYQQGGSHQRRVLASFVFTHADRIAVQSESMCQDLVHAFNGHTSPALNADALRRRLFVLPNGIDASASRADADAVLFVGRLVPVKGAHAFIEAARTCPGERFIVVGDGPERLRLEGAARDLNNVTFAGMVPLTDVATYLDRAKMLVVPSLQEGQSNAVMEAMARGIPVIASRVGGLPDLVVDGETGFLTEPGNVAALSECIRRLSADPALRLKFGENSVRAMQRHRWPEVIAILESALTEILATQSSVHQP